MNKKILNSVFSSLANHCPEAVGICEGKFEITYAELNSYANIVANILNEFSPKAERIIGIYSGHGIGYTASLLGIMKSGSVFMPVNPEFPKSRNGRIIDKTRPAAIIASDEFKTELLDLLTGLNIKIPVIVLSKYPDYKNIELITDQDASFKLNPEPPDIEQQPDDSCYVIHTSGSTGDPKAILGVHKGLSHFIHWEIGEFNIDEHCRIGVFAPPTFDVSLRDIFAPLIAGGKVLIPPNDLMENASGLIEWIDEQNVTHIHIVPSLFRLMVADLERKNSNKDRFRNLKAILLAGEPLFGRDVNRWFKLFGSRVELVNLYGPSEGTLAKCFNRLNEDSYPDEKIISVGKPISNTAILILKNNKLCAIGEIGEVHIKSPFISKGYLNDPDLTSKSFIQNPLNSEAEDIIYKTGDMGRYFRDWSIELLGRLDRQIKVNGNRIELGDIESAVLTHPNILQCFANVVSRENNNFIACYYTSNVKLTADDLRKHLANSLPVYMIPSFYIQMEKFPLLITGKIDKRRLPKPEEILYADIGYEAPSNETERKLAGIWSQILDIKKAGVNNPFFELGGTSLNAIKLISEIYQTFSVNVTLRDILQNTTIRQCAAVIDSKIEREKTAKIEPLPEQDYYEISAAQRRVWFLHQLPGGDVVNNIPAFFKIRGEIDEQALEKSFNYIVQRHEALRTAFVLVKSGPAQKICSCNLDFQKLRLPEDQEESSFLDSLFQSELNTPFELDKPPLLRCKLVLLRDKEYAFFLTLHHIIGDAISMDVIAQELFQVYTALREGGEPDLPELAFQYKDFAHWQNKYLNSEEGQKHRQFWHDAFARKVEPLEFPIDFPRRSVQTFAGRTFKGTIPDRCYNGLSALAKSADASLFTLLTALVETILYKYTGQNDITIGTATAGRNHPDLVNQVGLYVNLAAIRNHVPGNAGFKDFLNEVKASVADSIEHQAYPYDQLVDELNLERTMARTPLFDITIGYQEDFEPLKPPEGTEFEAADRDWMMSRYDITFMFRIVENRLQLDIIYNSSLFSEESMALLYDHFVELSQSAIDAPDQKIDDLNMLPLWEVEKIHEFAWSEDELVDANDVIDEIEARAVEFPDVVALTDGETEITYSWLSKQTDSIANFIVSKRLPPESIIGMIFKRSLSAIATQIGILKSGNAFMPVDPDFPVERIETLLDQSGCKHIVTCREFYDQAKNLNADAVFLDSEMMRGCDDKPSIKIQPDNLAYVIFTSGSTGIPKGVMVERRGLVNSIMSMTKRYYIEPGSRVLQFSSLNFDASISDIYAGLATGSTLFVIPQKFTENPQIFVQYLNEHKITHAVLPPILLRSLNKQRLSHLQVLVTAGETPYHEDIAFYSKLIPYINAYGPTECSICVATHRVTDADLDRARIPIGRPIPNLTVRTLDKNLKITPIGVPGELFVSGIGVARGYVNDPEMTAKCFIEHPELGSEQFYRTGDLVRWLPGGLLEYIGRIDKQVKIRGFRIEIGEIENALLKHPEIDKAAVIATQAAGGHKQLAAFISRSKAVRSIKPSSDYLKPTELRRYLLKKLPEYMVPQYFIQLESIPANISGKIDRRKLEEIFKTRSFSRKEIDRELTRMEKTLLEIWKQVLGREEIGVNDGFFYIGGDSIKAMQIIARLYQENLKLTIAEIFELSSIAECAKVIREIEKPLDRETVTGAVPLTPIQNWFFETYGDRPHHFHQSITMMSNFGIDFYALGKTLKQICENHDMLRARVDKSAGNYELEIMPAEEFKIQIIQKNLTERKNPAAALEEEITYLHESIDVYSGGMIRAGVYLLPEGEVLRLAIHHLVIDGVSWRIIMDDFFNAYMSYLAGDRGLKTVKGVSFKKWAEEIRNFAKSDRIINQLPYWKSQVNQSKIPLNCDFPDTQDGKYTLQDLDSLTYSLNADLTRQLIDMWAEQHIETHVYLLTLFARNVLKHQKRDKLSVIMEGHGREPLFDLDTSRTVGWFTSAYPVALSFDPSDSYTACTEKVKSSLKQIPDNGAGYGILRYLTSQTLPEARGLKIDPRVRFNYLGHFDADIDAGEFQVIDSFGDKNHAEDLPTEVDVAFETSIVNGELRFSLLYNKKLFSDMTMLEFYSGILNDIFESLDESKLSKPEHTDLGFDSDVDEMIDGLDFMDE